MIFLKVHEVNDGEVTINASKIEFIRPGAGGNAVIFFSDDETKTIVTVESKEVIEQMLSAYAVVVSAESVLTVVR